MIPRARLLKKKVEEILPERIGTRSPAQANVGEASTTKTK